MIGCTPKGRIVGGDRCPDPMYPRYPFGTIQYPRKLTDAEVEGFELEFLEYDSGLLTMPDFDGPAAWSAGRGWFPIADYPF
jgi:hypothetical protein